MPEQPTTPLDVLDGISSFMDSSTIDGHEVREWSTGQFSRLCPYLIPIATTLIDGGATLENLKSYLRENFPKLIQAVVPHMVPIITISCPTVTKEYLDEKPFTIGMQFIVLILKKNIEHIADFLDLKSGLLEDPEVEPVSKNSPQV